MFSQRMRIMNVLNAGGSITDNEARDLLGIERLGARICELRKMGIPIADTWVHGHNRYGDETKWKRYFLEKEDELQDNDSGQTSEP